MDQHPLSNSAVKSLNAQANEILKQTSLNLIGHVALLAVPKREYSLGLDIIIVPQHLPSLKLEAPLLPSNKAVLKPQNTSAQTGQAMSKPK
jgi:hypothetical protein